MLSSYDTESVIEVGVDGVIVDEVELCKSGRGFFCTCVFLVSAVVGVVVLAIDDDIERDARETMGGCIA